MVVIIAHRGNILGPQPEKENTKDYIERALEAGFHVEVDIWLTEQGLFLGHDKPEHPVTIDFLRDDRIICHCKNIPALNLALLTGLHCFSHDKDQAVLTSRGLIWLYPGETPVTTRSVVVLPPLNAMVPECYGVCTDYAALYS